MKSPAQRHFERVSAARAAASAAPGESLAGASRYELMLAKVNTDRVAIKGLKSVERKVEKKRAILPEYVDYVAGALEGGRGGQDDVLVQVMIWRIDIGDYAGALEIAAYALHHDLKLPDAFERDLATVIAEEFAEAALADMSNEKPGDTLQLRQVEALTARYDMPDQVRAKLFKAIGYSLQASDLVEALAALRRALELNDKAGVKKDIDRLEKQLAAAAGDSAGST